MYDPYASFESATLPNGLTVYAAYWPECPWEYMGFIIHSGAEQDPIGLEGLAHFAEHVVMNNSNIPLNEMLDFFEKHSAYTMKAHTGHAYTKFRTCVPTEDKTIVSKAFSMIGYMLFSARMKTAIEHERCIISEEIRRTEWLNYFLERKHKILFSSSWLERSANIYGNTKTVKRITPSDLQSFYDIHYTPANISIVCVGDMKLPEIIKLISESPLAENKLGFRTPISLSMIDFSRPAENQSINNSPNGNLYKSYARIPGNINRESLKILADMLYENLTEEMREQREWIYDIDVNIHNFRCLYELSIICQFKPAAADKINDAFNECIISLGSYEGLFEKIKQRRLVNNLAKIRNTSVEDIFNNSIENIIDYHRIITLAEIRKDIERTTMKDIKDLVEWLRPEMRWTYIVRP